MASAIPAGYEDSPKDYFESDSEDDSQSIVYPDPDKKLTSNGTPEFDRLETDDVKDVKDDSSPEAMYLSELEHFLTELDLKEFIDFFKQQRISYHDLISFNENDLDALDELGLGIKLKIWEGIKKEHKANWQPSRISYLDHKAQLNCADVVIMLKNIDNHLRHMQSTFEYLRNRLKKDPEMCSRWIEVANMNNVVDQSTETYATGASLMTTMKAFVQDVTCEEVIPNGRSKAAIKRPSKQKEPIPYKTVFFISGLFGLFTTMTYLSRESIITIFSRK